MALAPHGEGWHGIGTGGIGTTGNKTLIFSRYVDLVLTDPNILCEGIL